MWKWYNNFTQKFLMLLGIVMQIVYIPWACWYFNNTFKDNS